VMAKRFRPGKSWRVLAQTSNERAEMRNVSEFDELVVDQWLHVERMTNSEWWLQVGDARICVTVGNDGKAKKVTIERGEYD
jgi:hypothetical protein